MWLDPEVLVTDNAGQLMRLRYGSCGLHTSYVNGHLFNRCIYIYIYIYKCVYIRARA